MSMRSRKARSRSSACSPTRRARSAASTSSNFFEARCVIGSMTQALSILESVFGFRSFLGKQGEIIEHVANGGDALVLMPTGGGKSLCFQIPALMREGCGIVVSPLIALMHDQVAALREAGVRAACLNSSLSAEAAAKVERELLAGRLDLLYVAPERLVTPRFLGLLERSRLALFAIDEAHCVSQWGHDFRPEYVELTLLAERHPAVPRIALTATADEATRREIVSRLKLDHARVFISSFDRPNIRYEIVEKENARVQLLDFIRARHAGESGIVYCLSRTKTEETAAWLADHDIEALPYHAGMESAARAAHQDRFINEDGVVMVATIAFGMGIDKPDARFVAHLDLPKSIEAYYQETGRAGRDGKPAEAWMSYGLADIVQQRRMIDESAADDAFKRASVRKLDALVGLAETAGCRRVRLLAYFGEASGPCGNCDNCLNPPRVWDGTLPAQQALSCVYRTGQRFGAGHVDRRPARPGRRARLAARPRPAFHLRHRRRSRREAMARGVPVARRARPSAGGRRSVRRAEAHADRAPGAERRDERDAARAGRPAFPREARQEDRRERGRRRSRSRLGVAPGAACLASGRRP